MSGTYVFRGEIRDSDGALAERGVTIIRDATGAVVQTISSDPITGEYYSASVVNEAHSLLFTGEPGKNHLVFKGVMPELVAGPLVQAVLDATKKDASITLSGGDLVATKGGTAALKSVGSDIGVSAGKFYWEITATKVGISPFCLIGVGTDAVSTASFVGNNASGFGYYQQTGDKYTNNAAAAFGATWTTGDVLSVALDMDAGKVWFGKNGVWQGSGDPAAGTNPAFSGLTGTVFAWVSLYRNLSPAHVMTANFGQNAFAHAVPAGFSAGLLGPG